jgi:XRE family transcriptional regulator, aerobic/anaerobic benzoate catabolism transcriptional regulator
MHDFLNSTTAAGPPARPEALSPDESAAEHQASSPDDQYLLRLGERVREARARRGMSRRILARDSRVSERYLAQLEGGSGNISVLLLRQIAQALHVRLTALLQDEGAPPSELLQRIGAFLATIPTEKLPQVHEFLRREFAAPDTVDTALRRKRVALIGLRGAGKSTLGSLLAAELGVPFIELDRVIEQRSGLGLSVIFDLYGQSGFRRLERDCLDHVLGAYPTFVLATGGSLVSESATYERLLRECFTVWLRATPEEHMQRVIAQGDTRPMADTSENREAMAELKNILAGREPLYRRADITVDTSAKSLPEAFTALTTAMQLSPESAVAATINAQESGTK